MKQQPTTIKGLIEDLDRRYPHKCPDPKMSDREIWMYAGQRAMVDHLIAKYRLRPVDLTNKEKNIYVQ